MQAIVSSGDVTGAATKTILCILASTTRRVQLVQLTISCTDTPADATAVFSVGFITADGTGTGVTTVAVNSADGAPGCTAKKNYSGEPTYATNRLWRIGLNQRIALVWNAPYDGAWQTGLSGGGGNIGIGIQMVSGSAVAYCVDAQWVE